MIGHRAVSCAFALATATFAANTNWIEEAGGAVTRDQKGQIVAVDLRGSWVTDSDMPELARLPNLLRLDLSWTRISDRGLQQLKNAPAITELKLYYAEQITDEGMAAVKNWKRLKRVDLRGTKITDTTLEHLASIPSLESIDAGFAQITDVGVDRLTGLPNLKALTIGGNKLTDVTLQSLRQIPTLMYLDIGGSQRTDSGLWSVSLTEIGLDAIATLKELRHLRLNGTPISARGLDILKPLVRLERIDLQNCARINDEATTVLAGFPSLRFIDLNGTNVSAKSAAALRTAKPGAIVLHGAAPPPQRRMGYQGEN